MQTSTPKKKTPSWQIALIIALVYGILLVGQPAGLELPSIARSLERSPQIFLQMLIIGVSNGAVIVIIALGYTLVYGIIELVNFAHGDVFMIGAFIAMLVIALFSVISAAGGFTAPAWAALLAFVPAMLLCGALNWSIERMAYRPLRNSSKLAALIAAIGVSFILQNVGLQLASFGQLGSLAGLEWLSVLGTNNAAPKRFPTVFGSENLLGADALVSIRLVDVLVVMVAVLLWFGLNWFVNNTRPGKAMRATAQNRDAAAMMGIDVNATIGLTFIIAGALAGAAAVMFGLFNGSAVFTMGFSAGLRSFTAAVFGGIGNITGAALGGLLIGILASFSDLYLDTNWTNAWVFLILVLVLMFRPTGILGQEGGEKA